MITPARNVDLPERSTFLGGKAHRAFKKMPILSKLSRRLHSKLTTDAIPDPPRTESHVPNLSTTPDEELTKTESKSMPATPQKEQVVVDDTLSTQRQKSVPNDARPTTSTDFSTKSSEDLGDTRSTSESKEYKRSTKTKKYPKGTNIVITNSNGVNITNVKSYTCQVNQYSANDAAQSETASKTKLRPMPEDVQELSTCKEELGLDDMLIIKIHVGHGWRDIARKLLYLDGQIDQFEENFRHIGVDEIIYQLLLDWKQANTRDAQLGTLVSILWDCQEYDCVEQLAEARKNSS
ncbi:immune deficiency [Temnothorax longispinosus]|uniref:Receptor-interacting serine/threonine-protein kinase 1 n=1 Tax=Temnothorax longispinosus TaxID=300112 RepID=A0A4V3SB47_9HYME|nr:Receptor-interacting serine/threonine-protein kinase 1 [Temnothorax longispinosus]